MSSNIQNQNPRELENSSSTPGNELDIRLLCVGIATVVLFYIIGSVLHWTTGIGEIADLQLLPHLASIVGFLLAARWSKGRFFVHMLLVFGVSYILCGFYEDIWRRMILGGRYMWDYHLFTFPFWFIAFAIGSFIGRVFFRTTSSQS